MPAPPPDRGGDLADMCLSLPPVTRTLPWSGDAGMPQCFVACEPARPPNYFGGPTCKVVVADGGQALECTYYPCGLGRRPAGLVEVAPAAADEVGAYLARAAHLEAASVHAFRRLARELAALGAPRDLVAAARRAAGEEVRHARVTAALAGRHGAAVPKVTVAALGARDPEAIAVENAVEGCVGETWAALVATWQGEMAADRDVRAAMRAIAVDETGHAELAWDVAAWLDGLLDEAARARVVAARRAAAASLREALGRRTPAPLARALGLPDGEWALALWDGTARRLWA